MNPSPLPFAELREQAIALRRAGKSRREIKQILGITSDGTITKLVAGERPPPWTARPTAKDDLRAQALELREQGHTYNEIAAKLGVSKSSVSLWVRHLPRTGRLRYEEWRKRAIEGHRAYWEVQRPINEARRNATTAAAAEEIGTITGRELIIAGAIAYWCEGLKNKPYNRLDRVVFMNSDPRLIRFFLRFLDAAGISRDELIYQVNIHESADLDEALRFWLAVTGAGQHQFRRPTLKHHNPKTVRKNSGADYRGCLRVEVRRGSVLYRRIEGWARAAMSVQRTFHVDPSFPPLE